MTTFRVYLDIALYSENAFNDENVEDNEYDFADYRYEKFDENLVTNEQAPYVVKEIIKNLNWNQTENEHVTKFAYISNGKFVAEIKILDYSSNQIDDKDELYNYMLWQIRWKDEMDGIYIFINNKSYEVDMEIDDVYKLNSHGEELEFNEEDEDDDEEYDEEDDDDEEDKAEKEILSTKYNENKVKEEKMSLAYKEPIIEEENYEE